MKTLIDIQEFDMAMLELYEWLKWNKENDNDESYLNYAFIWTYVEDKVIPNLKEDIPCWTNRENIVPRWSHINSKIELDTFRGKVFLMDEIRTRKGKYYLRY
jgi:hypothetical protein